MIAEMGHDAISCILHHRKSSQIHAQCMTIGMHNALMGTFTEQELQGKRLREARKRKFATATDGWNHLKRHVKVGLQAYIQHENGNRGFKAHAAGYAKAYDTSPGWLLWGHADNIRAIEMMVAGTVAAGGEKMIDGDFSYDEARAVIFDPEAISLVMEVDGDSMKPRYHHRDRVLFGYRHTDLTPMLKKEVMVQAKDGRRFFKVLREGSRAGLFDLYSLNQDYDPIRDVEVDWVAPVEWVKV